MTDAENGVRRKVAAIFAEFAGDRANQRIATGWASSVIAAALKGETDAEQAADIAFHLSDWAEDAAFLVAVHIYPERFTAEEIREGVLAFLIHAPNHVVASAHLSGWPIQDVFKLGLKIGE